MNDEDDAIVDNLVLRPKGSWWWWYPETEQIVAYVPIGDWFDGPGGAPTRECRAVPVSPMITHRIGFKPWLRLKIKTRFRENEIYALRRMLKKVEKRCEAD